MNTENYEYYNNGYITLWMEGYAVTGGCGEAQFCGIYRAKTLREAVAMWARNPSVESEYINWSDLTYWGCKFFDNEQDARKHYG